jgi:hypothetical protein
MGRHAADPARLGLEAMKTSTLVMRRSMQQAIAAAEIGRYDLLWRYLEKATLAAPSSRLQMLNRLLHVYWQIFTPEWKAWYEDLIERGYRPVWRR